MSKNKNFLDKNDIIERIGKRAKKQIEDRKRMMRDAAKEINKGDKNG